MKPESPASALAALIEGNRRFAAGAPELARRDPARRAEVAALQHPRAAVVTCSDSRVGPEIVFDQGLGDIFVVRTAGNLIDTFGIASLEYATAHLGVPLVVVMGHSRCGAVEAAVKQGEASGHLRAIISALEPAIEAAKGRPGDLVDAAARENVRSAVAALEMRETVLGVLAASGRLRVVGAFYDIERGTVEFFA